MMREERQTPGGTFKSRRANNSATRYASLRIQATFEKPHGDACLAFRSWSAYSLPSTSRWATFGRAGRVPFGGRVRQSTTKMHDTRRHDGFDREFDRFDTVLPTAVKSQSRDGGVVYYNLTDLTKSLSRGTCARVANLSASASLSLSRERIGQISQIGVNPSAVFRFSFDLPRSTVVKGQSKSGQTGGGVA